MTHTTGVSKQFSVLALVCVCALLLAWLAPVLLLSGGMPELLQRGQGRPTDTLADGLTEMEDASDDPVVFVAGSQPGNLPVTFALQTDSLRDRAWSPVTLVRPPNSLNSI